MRNLILLTCVLLLISCKSEKKEIQTIEKQDNNIVVNDEIEGNLYFKVIIDAIVLRDDKFHLFYKELNDNGYSSERVVETIVKGNKNNQQIVFIIPETAIPNGLRLDFGLNYAQEAIKLNSVKISYGKNEFEFNKIKFAQLFKPNKFVSFNETTQLITTRPIDGKYDPNFVSINLEDILFSLMD